MPQDPLQATYRILDASANRASEGLRTMEEFSRFVLDDIELTSELKSIRHDLATAMRRLPRAQLLAARDTPGDVGTSIREPSEYARDSLACVATAAASRTTQSLRVLEEYGKTIDALIAADIEQIRYRCYATSAKLELRSQTNSRHSRLDASILYVLIDAGSSEAAFGETVLQLSKSGVDILQLRDRDHDDRTLIRRAHLGTQIAHQFGTMLIMNDRADLALAADTDGVHVGQDELPVADARRIVGPNRLVGLSTHSIEQARKATELGADYIGCGPVFAGRTKTFDRYVGTRLLTEVAREIKIPAFAIGGIELGNVDEVIQAGCRRIAVTGVVRDAANPTAVVATLKERLAEPQKL